MPDDSSGIYSLPAGTIVATGDTILPSQHNPWANDNANAMSNRFSKDGRAPATGNWNLNNFRITGLGTPVATTDAVTKAYADSTSSNNIYSLVSTNISVGVADKGKYYRTATAGIIFSPGAAATLGANHFFKVKNDSSGIVLVDPSNGSETINGQTTLTISPGAEAFVICDGANFFGAGIVTTASANDFVSGLTLSNNISNPNTHVDISTGSAKRGQNISFNTVSYTKRLNGTWAAGSGNGGLDTGVSAVNTTYHIFSLRKQSDGTFDAVMSLSATSPTMTLLTGYDVIQRLGAVRTNGSGNIILFQQVGNFYRVAEVADFTSGVSVAKALMAVSVPVGARVLALFRFQANNSGNSSDVNISTSPGDNSNLEVVQFYSGQSGTAPSGIKISTGAEITNTSGQIYRAAGVSGGGGQTAFIYTYGWQEITIPRVG